MSQKLRDLIRRVRACKTAAEERAVIAKESALIRTACKDQDKQYRHRNVAKLLFIHMLGYPSHFGQMECVKLIASPFFAEKRMGYLGLILLLSDQEDVLTLVTNSMKNDLGNANHFIVALSLTAIGNIASPDMARDLVMDIDKHLRGDNDYLKKKAALASIRIFTKVPELVEDFVESISNLLHSKNHGVLLAGVQLLVEVLALEPEVNIPRFIHLLPDLVKELRLLLSMGYSSEYDISGIADPFLQVALLSVLRLLGKYAATQENKKHEDELDAMNDVLAQVATNTETAKTAGNAILYECVQTIMSLPTVSADNSLKVLAVNILGRFLLNRDNNIRYVALNTLSKVVAEDSNAVQRHTNTIVDCLKDPDTSIRQRALELIYMLVNNTNIQPLAREMLNYLVVAPVEQKATLCSRIADAVDRYAPSSRWQIDTLITMLSIAGASLPDERICSSLIMLIQRNPELHAYVVKKLFSALQDDISQLSLVHVGLWCIGEYGGLLLQASNTSEQLDITQPGLDTQSSTPVDETKIVLLFKKVLQHHKATDTTRAYALNAMAKLTMRFKSDAERTQLENLIKRFESSMNVELQQRATEYITLGKPAWQSLRAELLATMPAMDITKVKDRNGKQLSSINLVDDNKSSQESTETSTNKNNSNNLLDLDDIFGGGSSSPARQPVSESVSSGQSQLNTSDLLADIFSGGNATNPPPAPNSYTSNISNELLGFMDFGAPANETKEQSATTFPPISAYDKNGIKVTLHVTKPKIQEDASITHIQAQISNSTSADVTNFVFLAAFPKYISLEMDPPSSSIVPANQSGALTQLVKIKNAMHGEKPVLMRMKLEFVMNGQNVEDMIAVSGFPPNV